MDAFDDADRSVGSISAARAAVALRTAHPEERLIAAIKTRDIVRQAKDIIAIPGGIDATAAFAMVIAASGRMNIKLHKVARQTVDR